MAAVAIEHEPLRPVYRDPRVHCAVNCASIGCAEVLGDDAQRRQAIAAEQFALYFLDYDWSLNDFRSSSRP